MHGKHARPPAWTPAVSAAPAFLAAAGMTLATAQHPPVITPRTPSFPGIHPGARHDMISTRARPGLAYLALKMMAPKVTHSTTYTVQPGDCLWTIAQKYYGSGGGWSRIFDANRGIIHTPGLIIPGQQLVIPGASSSAPAPAPAPAPASSSAAPATPADSSETAWITSFLGALGAPDSAQNLATMTQWIAQEQPWSQATQSWNPLNTMESGFGSTSTFGIGISIYPTEQDGLNATVAAMNNGFYPAIIAALKNSQPMSSYGPWSRQLSTWSGGGYSVIAPGTP